MQQTLSATAPALGFRLAPPLVAGFAAWALASQLVDTVSAAEISYLALLGVPILLCAGALAPRPALEPALGALALLTVFWTIPGGHGELTRGVLTVTLATLAFASALTRRLVVEAPVLRLPTVITAAIGVQIIARGERLLAIDDLPRTLVGLIGLPTAVALCLVWLARGHGFARALLIGAVTVCLGPGWNVASTLALATLAAVDFAAANTTHRDPPRWSGLVGLPALVAAPLWDLRLGAIVIACATTLLLLVSAPGRGDIRDRRVLAAAVLVAGLVIATLIAPAVDPPSALETLLLGLLVVPWIVLPDVDRWPLALAAFGLTVAAALGGTELSALAAPLALAVLALPERGIRIAAQASWSGALAALALPFAAYPWLRTDAVESALAVLGLHPTLNSALVLIGLAVIITTTISRVDALLSPRHSSPDRSTSSSRAKVSGGSTRIVATPGWVAVVIGCLALVALVFVQIQPTTHLSRVAETLDRSSPELTWTLSDPRPIRQISIESSLANAAELPAGTAVATLEIAGTEERQRWILRIGEDTGEWAARRDDLVAAGVAAPQPSRVSIATTPSGSAPVSGVTQKEVSRGREFFSSRYRSSHRTTPPIAADRLTLRLRPDLPRSVELTVFELEVSP